MKQPNELAYDMRAMRDAGFSVDDIAFDFNMSNAGVYKHLKNLSEFEAFGRLAELNGIDCVAHFGEIEITNSMDVIKMYKMLTTTYMNKEFSFAISADDRTVSLNMSGWNKSVSKRKTDLLINDLQELHIRFPQPNMFHIVSDIAANEPIRVFESVKMDDDQLTAIFAECFANLMEMYKVMAIKEKNENTNEPPHK